MSYTTTMIYSRERQDSAITHVAHTIERELANNRAVLWLVSGGSAVAIQVAIMQQLSRDVPDTLTNLTIIPVDERYGPVWHANSNSAQMRQAGFNPGSAKWFDVLDAGSTMSETLERYEELVEDSFARAKVVIATLGLGVDGHTAGVLPDSPAALDSTSTVIGYEWSDYTRMTLGLAKLRQIDDAFVFAYGEAKRDALRRISESQEPLSSLPAKVLYGIPTVTVYNDCITSEE